MKELITAIDDFSYNYDVYGYRDAFGSREEGREHWRQAIMNHRGALVAALQEIADDSEHAETAQALIYRIKAIA